MMSSFHLILFKRSTVTLVFVFIIFLLNPEGAKSQTPGIIFDTAAGSGKVVLDPNGDGYTSATSDGFAVNDEVSSEIPYVRMVFPMDEPTSDLGPGTNCGFTDFAQQAIAIQDPAKNYLDPITKNWLFRMRMSNTAPNSTGYSILIDTDGKIGSSGLNADPDFQPGNIGFEIEILLATNFGVYIYNVDGASPSATPVKFYAGHTNYQKSVALTKECGTSDYFIDFFVDFDDITEAFPSISTSTPLRMAVIDNMSPHSSVFKPNSRSDLAGSNCHANFDLCMLTVIDNYTPCPPGLPCPDRSTCPSISGPIYSDYSTFSGTSNEASGTTINLYVYASDGVTLVRSGSTITSGFSWTMNVSSLSPSGTLSAGQIIKATATAPGKGTSIYNCSLMTVLAGAVPCTATSPTYTVSTNEESITITTTLAIGTILRLYELSGSSWSLVVAPWDKNQFVTTTSPQSVNFNYGSNAWSATYKTTAEPPTGCESDPTYMCKDTLSTTPTISTNPITNSTVSLNGTCGTNAIVEVFKNGVSQGTTSGTGTWTKSGLTFNIGDLVFVISSESGKCNSLSLSKTVTCTPSTTPLIAQPVYSGDNKLTGTCGSGATVEIYKDGVSIGNASVTGTTWSSWPLSLGTLVANSTSFEAVATEGTKCPASSSAALVNNIPVPSITGTYCGPTSTISGIINTISGSIQLYNSSNVAIGSPVTIGSSGTWLVTGLNLSPGDQFYAIASWSFGSVSGPSATISIGNKTTNPVAITTNPVYELSTTISGTGVNGDMITLYLGGTISTYSATVNSSGIWQITGIPSYELFSDEEIWVTATKSGLCESSPSASRFVQCLPHLDRSISASSTNLCFNSKGTITIANSEVGIFYTPVLNDGFTDWGFTAAGTGSNLNLTTFDLISNPSIIKVKASKIPSDACDGPLSGSIIFTLNPLPVAPSGAASQTFCGIGSYTLANLAVTAPLGGVIDWYSHSVDGVLRSSSTPLVSGTTYYAESRNSTNGCKSSTRTAVTVTAGTPAIPTAAAAQSFCSGATIADIVATLSSTGVIRWYAVSSGGTPLPSSVALTTTTTYYAETFDGSCVSSLPRRAVTATIVSDPAISVHPVSPTAVCIGGSLSALSVAATGGTPSLNYQWYSNTLNNNTTGILIGGATSSSYTPISTIAGTTYYYCAVSAAGGGCGTANSNTATVTIIDLPTAPTSAQVDRNIICADDAGNIALSVTGGSGNSVRWYTGSCGGTSIGTGNPLSIASPASTTTYYGRWENTCDSSNCASVSVTVNSMPATFNVTGGGSYCSGDSGMPVLLEDSELGVNYQLFLGAETKSSPVTGTGNAISFGDQTSSGTYSVKGTNTSTGCTINMLGNVSIAMFPDVSLSFTTGVTSACEGSAGNIYAVQAGMLGYIWTISAGGTITSGGGNYDNSVTITWNTAGEQSVSVIYVNLNGCTSTSPIIHSVTVKSTPATPTVSVIDNCNGSSTLTASGYTGDLQWSTGATSSSINVNTAGIYTVTQTVNGCTSNTESGTAAPNFTPSASITSQNNVLCFGSSTGSVTVSGSGGSGSYTYALGSGSYGASGNFGSLYSGSYTVHVKDLNGCIYDQAVMITEPDSALAASGVQASAVSCFGGNDGSATITPSGGTSPYTIIPAQNGLTSDTITFTVTDAKDCTTSVNVAITQPTAITASASVSKVISCNGGTGTVTITASGGKEVLSYTFDGVTNTTGIFSGISAGTAYAWSVTDANNCGPNTGTLDVTQPTAITAVALVSKVISCNGGTGTVTITASGGKGVLSYTFDGVTNTTGIFSGISAGTAYAWSVTDTNSCGPNTGTLDVAQPKALSFGSSQKTDAMCYDTSTGSVTAGKVTNAVGTVSYTWKNSGNSVVGNTSTVSNLPIGIYALTVSDDCSSLSNSVSINQPAEVYASGNNTDAKCIGSNTGSIDLNVTGGSGSYSYLWSNGATTQDLNNLREGEYSVIITELNGCPVNGEQSFQIKSINNSPISVDDMQTISEDQVLSGNASVNDTPSCDGGNVWTLIGDNGGALNGTVTMNADGIYNYIPTPNFNGNDSFTYQICDINGDCDSAVVTFTVTSVNDKPIAVNDVFYDFEDIPIIGETVARNDIPSGDGGNVWSLVGTDGGVLNGIVNMYPDGSFDYFPNPDFNGTENFTYQICDVDGECETARVTIILDAVGDAPYSEDDIVSTIEDTPIIGASVIGNDIPSGDGGNGFSLFGTNGGAMHGKVVMTKTGTYSYTPEVNFIGTDVFIYLLCDIDNDCSGAQVTITVNPANDSPVATEDINTTLMEMPVSGNFLTNDNDPEGDPLMIKTNPVITPAHGTLLINSDGSYTYTPNQGYSGTDSFVYEVCDNGTPVRCDQATVTIKIIELLRENNTPVAINDVYEGSVGISVNGNVISNDFDPDGNLNINSVSVIGMDPQNGMFNMNSNGTFTYIPNPRYLGQVSFDYRICDMGTPALCDLATVTIEILANPDKNSTFATDDSYFGREDNPISDNVFSNDNDPQGNIQTVNTTPVVSPKHGAVILNSNGTFTYTPEPNFIGSDQFAYRLCDDGIPQACDLANVYLIIAPVNDSPMAEDDINTTFKNMPVTGNVLTNDSDPEVDLMNVKTNPVVPPAHGTVAINPDGTYLYAPNSEYSGTDSFVYEVCDNGTPVMCAQAKVTIKVIDLTSKNNPPVAIIDAYQGSIGLTVSGNVISNDFDPDGNLNPTSVTLVSAVSGSGELILKPDGTFTYIPEAGYLGRISFDYRICDTGTPTLCDVATVTIDMQANPNGNSTFATDDSFFGKEDNQLTGKVLANDYDAQGDLQSVNTIVVIPPNHGSVSIDANGNFVYKPVPNYFGQDRFVYEVCDNSVPKACDMTTVYLILLPGDDVPVAVDDTNSTNEEASVTGNVSSNDNPSFDGGSVWSIVDLPEQGELVFNPDGSYIFTPDTDFNGINQFVYKLCDIDGDCSEATVSITVNPVNDLPEANDDAIVYHLEGIIDTTVVENDILSGDGGNVWSIVTPPANGSIIFNQDGTLTYTAKPNFIGTDSFIYQLCDANGDCDQARVTIHIEDVIQPNQIFTPNGDGQNDTYLIAGIEYYPESKLTIFNRWGNIVYRKIGYLNDWDGFSNVSKVGSTALPVGTYFYVLDYGVDKHKAGYVYLER